MAKKTAAIKKLTQCAEKIVGKSGKVRRCQNSVASKNTKYCAQHKK